MCALRLPTPGLDFLSPATRGPQRRSRTIGKSTQLAEEIARIMEITNIVASSPQIRKKKAFAGALMT
jgi:hypothetical protein